jgi:hypothetical protein
MRRWERPFHDFLMPYLRGTAERLTGQDVIPAEVRHRRDLDTLADMMTYLRGLREVYQTRSLPPAAHIKLARGGRERRRPGQGSLSRSLLSCRRASACVDGRTGQCAEKRFTHRSHAPRS